MELHLPSASFGLSSVDPAPEQVSSSRRATSLLPSASDVLSEYLCPSGEVFLVVHCHESLDVLAKYLSLPGESRLFLLPGVSQCTVRVPSICLGELHLPSAPVGPDFVCQILRKGLLVSGLSSVILHLSR